MPCRGRQGAKAALFNGRAVVMITLRLSFLLVSDQSGCRPYLATLPVPELRFLGLSRGLSSSSLFSRYIASRT